MLYVARQEGFEEMAEELFQDGVKQVASQCLWSIDCNKRRYSQRMMTVILKMLTLPFLWRAI
jgi:hypothetical protein